MRWLPLFLSGALCFGGPAEKKAQPDKVHLSLTYSERNGLAFPSAGGIGLLTVPLLGGAALASSLGGIGNLGNTLNDLFSGKEAGIPKTGGEMERMMSSPQGDALVALASRLPLSCNYRAQLEADLVWDVAKRAYVVSSGTLIWTGGNNSRFESKGLLLYCNLSGGGNHRLKRDEVMVKFSNGDLSKALAAKGKKETLTYELILDVKPKEEAITGDAGYLSQTDGHVVYQTQDRFTTAGQMTNVNVIDGYLKENIQAEPMLFSKNLAYQAEEREIREGNADFSETWMAPGGTQTAIRWTFNPPKDEEMVFVVKEAYDKWIPAPRPEDIPGITPSSTEDPWKPLEVKVKIRTKREGGTPRKGKIRFTLEEVSKNSGFCINFPVNGSTKVDLRFAKTQPQGITLQGTLTPTAETNEKVLEASVILESTDPGAYGKLKATCAELDLKALHEPTNTYALALPRDDDGNHIADAWEEKNGAKGLAATWDGAEVSGQATKGDGLALYEKYRGAVVLEGSQQFWKRLAPKEKVLFVVDEGGIFLPEAWKSASGITAYRVSPAVVEMGNRPEAARYLNTSFSQFRNGRKYAVVISLKEDSPAGEEGTLGWTKGNPPWRVQFCEVFRGTCQKWISNLIKNLQTAVADSNSPERAYFTENCKFPLWLVDKALKQLQDPVTREKLVQQQLRATAIHELGHACSLPGHVVAGKESNTGNKLCFMCYTDIERDWQFTALQTLFKSGSLLPAESGIFCKDSDFNCFSHFDIKDQ